ncbi:MAG: ABC transporter permease [Patescibacteria group bacterium]
MRTTDLIEEMYLGVTANKIRSGLTMLGIVIGIASVIAMLSVGEGSKAQIQASIQSIGSNLLLVMPGAQRGGFVSSGRGSAQTLTLEDAEALKSVAGVAAVAPESSKRYQVTAKSTNTNTSVIGTSPEYAAVRNVTVAEGVFFTAAHSSSRAKVAVIGSTTRDDLFGEGGNAVGQKIRVNGMEMTVIGVLKAKGGSGATNQDDQVLIPISTMETYFAGTSYVGTISIQATDQASMTSAQEAITQTLLTRHKKEAASADFSVLNQADIVSTASSVTDTFSALLAAIASISLLVGGIGIMNMMLTTVTERTKEIGLRQSIGAERNEIIAQFLGEAILLTVMGGAIGIVVGWGLAKIVSTFMSTPTVVAWSSVWLAFGVSAAIGLVFGYYPARRAAALNPIQALRYE